MTHAALREPAATVGHDTRRVVEDLLFRQSEALDRQEWEEFRELFTSDGVYWIPAEPHHTTWKGVPCICAEDRDLMSMRIKRLRHPRAWSQLTSWATNHVIGNIRIERVDADANRLIARSRFHMMEYRRDEVRHFAGSYEHTLVAVPGGYRIALQRVDLVNADGPFEYVLLAWV
jgi:3-phenylpropionate/cinnamic acid dioxygenase small subunit